VRASKVDDKDVIDDIQQNMELATGQFGSSLVKKKTGAILSAREFGGAAHKDDYQINIGTQSTALSSNAVFFSSSLLLASTSTSLLFFLLSSLPSSFASFLFLCFFPALLFSFSSFCCCFLRL
jgi:hypothetical protein